MARPTEKRVQAPVGFTPETREAPRLGVHASLNVNTAPSGAEQLAQALGLATRIAEPILTQKITKDAFDRTSAGKNAATLNAVDAKREQEDNLYARGVKFATKERAVRNALAEVDRKIAEVGAEMSPHQRAKARDDMLKEHLEDMVNDPESSGIAADLVGPWQTRNLAADNLEVIKEAEEKTIEATQENVQDQMADGTFNYMASVALLTPVIGRERAVENVVVAVGEAAVNLRDERLIDQMLPDSVKTDDGQTIDGPRKSNKYQEVLDTYRKQAHTARLEDAKQVRREQKSVFETAWIPNPERFTLKDYNFHIKQEDSLFSSDELNSYLARGIAERERIATTLEITDLRAGNPNIRLRMLKGQLAQDGKPITDEDLARQANRDIENEAAATGVPIEEVASTYAAREGYVYQPIANDLQRVPPSDTQMWGKAVEQYFKLSPEARQLHVPSDDQRARFERSQALAAAGKKPEEIAVMLDQTDERVVRSNREQLDKKWDKARLNIKSQEVNDGGWMGLSSTVGTVANRGYIESRIKAGAQARVDMGTDVDTAIKNATADVIASHVLIPGPTRDKNILLPRTAEITDDFRDTVLWFHQELPAWLKENGYDADPTKLKLSTQPGSDQNTVLTLVDENGWALDHKLKWKPADLEAMRMSITDKRSYDAAVKLQRERMLRSQQPETPFR